MNNSYFLRVEENANDVKLTQRALRKANIADEPVIAEVGAK